MSEGIIYEVAVPEAERAPDFDDTPEAYRVVASEGLPTCMVYGRYSRNRLQPEWVPNPSCRWLVRHLIGRLNELVELKDWRDSYDPV